MNHTGVTPLPDDGSGPPPRGGRLALAVAGLAAVTVVAAGCSWPAGGGGGGGGQPAPSATPTPTATAPTTQPTRPAPTPTAVPTQTATAKPTPPPTTPPPPPPAAGGSMSGLHVSGKTILNGSGQAVRLLGVDRSGSEYSCLSNSFFDGPVDDASVAAMTTWKINAVRVPLNEDCWLGINGVPAQYSGAAYQQAIAGYVARLRAKNLAVILDLHWNGAGTTKASGQQDMADADHAPAFWTSVATAYKGDTGVLFDLYNEPHDISWTCWRDGGNCGTGYQVAGMQSLVNAVRSTGATNIVMAGENSWAGDVSQWLTYRPSDPTGNLVASDHNYNFSGCNTTACLDSQAAPVLASVPVVFGEIGETDCSANYVNTLLPWLDAHGASYLAWAWDTYGCGFPGLISNYDGTPTAFGTGVLNHLRGLAG